jgi:phosphopantothenoylcysteine decarboxylase / phosphopantothenate---cysteine ligase
VAAVADYAAKNIADIKLKKSDNDLSIELERTTDIAGTLASLKKKNQIAVGFALETNNALENASKKVTKKNFDFIVLNSLQDKGAGFRFDTNKIKIVHQNGVVKEFDLKTKDEVAMDILYEVKTLIENRNV